ncbi:hypothetical protein AB0F11_37820 [Streptomyces sp. NPDC032472]|uniref:hypothetical protein n=1 Tax=Streptomyces sp. NPDC032472 TaxID=3155018 RepID=UPI00340899B8
MSCPRCAPYTDEALVLRAQGWAVLRALALIDIGRAGDRDLPGARRAGDRRAGRPSPVRRPIG